VTCLFVALAVFVGCELLPEKVPVQQTILSILIMVFLAAGGFAFNGFGDVSKDRLNPPHKPLVSGKLSPDNLALLTEQLLLGSSQESVRCSSWLS